MSVMLVVCLYLILQMSIVWLVYRATENPSYVDVSWSIGIAVSGLIYLATSTFLLLHLLSAAFLIIWCTRLAGYIYLRIAQGEVDKRYEQLSAQWTMAKSKGFFINFQFQGFLILFVSLPLYFIASRTSTGLSLLDIIGMSIIALGIIGEIFADKQLAAFKRNPSGPVCNVKLWSHCRHPNYFFEWLIWCGFAVLALPASFGWLGLLSPALMYWIMAHITGPITEANSLKSRGEAYAAYQKTVPMFFPRWPF